MLYQAAAAQCARLYQLHTRGRWLHFGRLKSATVGKFTPQKLAKAASQSCFPPRAGWPSCTSTPLLVLLCAIGQGRPRTRFWGWLQSQQEKPPNSAFPHGSHTGNGPGGQSDWLSCFLITSESLGLGRCFVFPELSSQKEKGWAEAPVTKPAQGTKAAQSTFPSLWTADLPAHV